VLTALGDGMTICSGVGAAADVAVGGAVVAVGAAALDQRRRRLQTVLHGVGADRRRFQVQRHGQLDQRGRRLGILRAADGLLRHQHQPLTLVGDAEIGQGCAGLLQVVVGRVGARDRGGRRRVVG
jgi:hypothetical protein